MDMRNRITEEQLLSEIEWLVRKPRIFVPTSAGYRLVEFTPEKLEQAVRNSPYLEPGSVAHITQDAA
jgi:hypothetical protein